MAADVVVIGGTSGIGHALAASYCSRGARVTISGRDEARATAVAAELGGEARGIAFDLAEPHSIADALRDTERVDRLALVAVDRDQNTVAEYDIDGAIRLVTLKLVGYSEVVHQLADRLTPTRRSSSSGGWRKTGPTPARRRSRR